MLSTKTYHLRAIKLFKRYFPEDIRINYKWIEQLFTEHSCENKCLVKYVQKHLYTENHADQVPKAISFFFFLISTTMKTRVLNDVKYENIKWLKIETSPVYFVK